MNETNNFFPHLIESELKQWASNLANHHFPDVPIQKICLYKYSSAFQRYYVELGKNLEITALYCNVFEIDDFDPTEGMFGEDAFQYSFKVACGEKPPQPYQALSSLISKGVVKDEKRYLGILNSDFEGVYRQQPPKANWRDDWFLTIKLNHIYSKRE